jgi:hypothetical protein
MKTRVWVGVAVISIVICVISLQLSAQQPTNTVRPDQAKQGLQKAMQVLASDSQKILEKLKPLTKEQKNAVIALMTISRAAATYESRFMKKDDTSIRSFYGSLRQFAPAYKTPGKFQSRMGESFDAQMACATAQQACRKEGKSDDDCDSDPKVIVPCANEMIIFIGEFKELHQGIPQIMQGKDPWPPIPFPY